jgi:hypothetical protein
MSMIALPRKYDCALGAGPNKKASSAKRTCGLSRSASEYTATVFMPISRAVRITRRAISPLFATSSFSILRIPLYYGS